MASTTRASRISQINCYFRFCDHYGLISFPCSPEQACLYAALLSEWMTPASIVNYLSAVWHRQQVLGYESHATNFIVQQTIRGLRRCFARPSSSRSPISVDNLKDLYSFFNMLLPSDLVFWAAVTLAFRALLRKCHYTVSSHSLQWSDVHLYPDHLVLTIRSSKTDQFSMNPHRIVLNSSPGSILCPIYWLGALADAHIPREDDFIFRTPGPHGLCRMPYLWFSKGLNQLARAVGMDPSNITSHSLRHGGASLMSALGCDIADIRARGSWASSAIFRYLHHSDDTLRMKDSVIADYL